MLQRHAALNDAAALSDRGQRWILPLVLVVVALTLPLAAMALAPSVVWIAAVAVVAIVGLVLAFLTRPQAGDSEIGENPRVAHDMPYALTASSIGLLDDPVIVTDEQGRMRLANAAYLEALGKTDPMALAERDDALGAIIRDAREAALADGRVDTFDEDGSRLNVRRIDGEGEGLLLWHLQAPEAEEDVETLATRVAGEQGERLGRADIMAVVIDEDGHLLAANRLFTQHALPDRQVGSPQLEELIISDDRGLVRFAALGEGSIAYRMVDIPVASDGSSNAGTVLFLPARSDPSMADSSLVQSLLDLLPLGLALVDRDGRFVTMNKAFNRAGGVKGETPSYPGDLVVKEDKATVADAVRRNARGPAMSTDIAVRLATNPKEPVALTVAGLRGIGNAAVLLLLKDNSEEAKLKRQIAQATKMQAVGQLAGGVAHDFNNILTAIIGHCDLMLMRHTPGDSDYDDIQQIKSNSNRAAGLTRQLLAFSRQQTLRPQVLQLADVVAEVSHLLKRLLGETVQLKVKHGRDVGLVRIDPGQLEQVIINLAVNARDAMFDNGGGTLTIQTYPVQSEQVADLGSEILPVADYSALSISDTGSGIAPAILGKIFEPFFTTKEVGKGTGLGLSTVYGIVKQSGGYIFADSKVGEGTSFVIYLPVHEVHEEKVTRSGTKAAESESELWGSGTVLLVEDEPMVRTVAQRALSRHGYDVLTATNGEEALELLETTDDVALLVSDVVMPLMDGPTMGREARKDRPDLPILFMSGYAEEQLRKSIDIDNVSFLPKPFSVQELAEAVRGVLSDKAGKKRLGDNGSSP